MTKKHFSCFAAISLVAALFFSCTPPASEVTESKEQETSGELEPFAFSAKLESENSIFEGKPVFSLHLENPNAVAATAEITLNISTDKGKKYTSVEINKEVAAKSGADVTITTDENLEPGFYRATGKIANKKFLSAAPFGVDPFHIPSPPDSVEGFKDFWAKAYEQLEGVEMNTHLIQTNRPGTYMVEMQSIPDGLSGEPMTIRGYYIEPPKEGGPYPAIVHYYGYDDFTNQPVLELPYGNSDYAHLWLSTRGQRINSRSGNLRQDGIDMDFVNPYDKQWFTVNFGDKDSYYYRGAYMDCVQGIRFLALCQDEKVKDRIDLSHIYVEGMSQGGAFSYAAAALSKEYPVRAIAAAVAFMGDFPIVPNEGGGFPWMARDCKSKLGLTDDQMYEFLSYFDTKNLATQIDCPIFAAIGLLDNVCPPHTNIAPYNNALTPADKKQMTFYPKMGHAYPSGWDTNYIKFFKEN